jgi:hypothetical protein
VLFVKNLSPKVTEQDLASLFIQFQDDDSDRIVFKLLNGRMKGQAFVTFNSKFVSLFGFYIAPPQYRSYCDVPALLVEEDLGCPSVHYFRANGHLSRTTEVL